MNYFYARVSTDRLSFENQLSQMNAYAAEHNLSIDRTVKDISDGFENKRGNRLFDLLNQMNENDILYCYNLSRISRRANKLFPFYALIKSKNINLIFLFNTNEETIIKDAPIELSVILSNVSEIDAEYISIITKTALNGLKEKGVKLGRPQKYDSETIQKVIDLHKTGLTAPKVAEELHIPYETVWRMIKISEGYYIDTRSSHEYALINIPLETRLEIWGDRKIGKTTKELAEMYQLDIETIEIILKSLKGGGHW